MTTITKDQMILHDNEVYVITEKPFATLVRPDGIHYLQDSEKPYYVKERKIYEITHSTASLAGVTKLDRIVFVKPKDVESLAINKFPDGYNKHTSHAMRQIWVDGYNANKGEFTREEMIKAMNSVASFTVECSNNPFALSAYIDGFMNGIRQISIPNSITINNNEVTVNWE